MRATLTFAEQREVNTLLNNWAATPPAVGHPCPICRRVFVQTTTPREPCEPCQDDIRNEEYYASLTAEREAEEADRDYDYNVYGQGFRGQGFYGRGGHSAWCPVAWEERDW